MINDSNRQSFDRPNRSRASEFAILLMVAAPPLLLAALFASGAIADRIDSRKNHATIEKIRRDGLPVDNHTMTTHFDDNTSSDRASEWQLVFLAAQRINNHWDFRGSRAFEDDATLYAPGEEWTAAPIAYRQTELMQPIFDTIDQLTEENQAVWQPIIFSGYETSFPSLNEPHRLIRNLENAFRVAVHSGNHDLAIKSLDRIAAIANSFDWRQGLVTHRIYMGNLGVHDELIRRSAAINFWNADDWESLRRRLEPMINLRRRWIQAYEHERAMLLSLLDESAYQSNRYHPEIRMMMPYGCPETVRRQTLRQIDKIAHTDEATSTERAEPLFTSTTETFHPTIAGQLSIPFANSENLCLQLSTRGAAYAAERFAEANRDRRWTLTVLAIKQFVAQYDRWPTELSELSDVGLQAEHWIAVNSQPFGYQIADDQKSVLVWTTARNHGVWAFDVPPVPPSELSFRPDQTEKMQIRILRPDRG